MVGPYRRFGKTYVPKRWWETTIIRCVECQKSADPVVCGQSKKLRDRKRKLLTSRLSDKNYWQDVCAGHKYNFSCKITDINRYFLPHRVNKYFRTKGQNCREWNTFFFMTLISCAVTNASASRLQLPCSLHQSVSRIFRRLLLRRSWKSSRQVRLWSTRVSTLRLPANEPTTACLV